ncbi:MAG: hypothetical protein EAZ85_12600 [Bacteroidetes bacterium]|nr:MAG: hypothetical protein EAZ85_12600 [Bacteroidota bacterium]TAG87167.1 MAG: hypothetical protein EAZ20_11155 [Bacteroidota bacterium]
MKKNYVILSIILSLFYLFFCANFIQAQNDTLKYYQPKATDLLNMPLKEDDETSTQIAGQTNFIVREAPAAITIITDEQLTQWGITDFIEIFRFVPGFEVNFDIGNVYGLSIRGNWGGEAKILYMIDGIQMNELNYGSVSIGSRFSITAIKKIEIIRGPGSSLYGGLAGLSVINIITKSGQEKDRIESRISYDNSEGRTLRQLTEFSITKKINNNFSIQLHTALQDSKISNRIVEFQRGKANYGDSSNVYNKFFNLGLQYKNLRLKAIYDEYKIKRTLDIYAFDSYNDFTGAYIMADYTWKINPKLTIIPEVSLKTQEPWNIYGGGQEYYAMIIRRAQTLTRIKYDWKQNLQVSGGFEYYNLNVDFKSDTVTFFTGKKELNIDNIGAFAEISFESKYVNIVGGARYDKHSFAGEAFVPRLAFTKAFKKFHYKALYSEAFKTPIVSNLQLATSPIRPENIRYAEIELGYKINTKFNITANFFLQNISNSIVYSYTASVVGGYSNEGESNSFGAEFQLNYTSKFLQSFIQYSFYRPQANSTVSRVENIRNSNQGISPHKITLHTHIRLHRQVFLTTNVSFFSQRYYYGPMEFQGDNGVRKLDNITLIDVTLWWKNAIKNLDFQFYVRDLTNEKFSHIAAYKVDLYPLPAPARTFGIRVMWKM